MRLLIIPRDANAAPIEDEIIELETTSEIELSKKLYALMKGRMYSIEVYKNLKDFAIFNIGEEEAIAFYIENKNELKLEFTKNGYEEIVQLIKTYIKPNGSSLLKTIFINQKEIEDKIKKENYDRWKAKYEVQRVKDKKLNLLKYSLFGVILVLIFYTVYLLKNDELRFIGRENLEKKAVIVNTYFYPTAGGYYQKVFYEFKHNNKTYKAMFTANKFIGKQFNGDSVMVKFRKNNPNVSKYLYTVYEE